MKSFVRFSSIPFLLSIAIDFPFSSLSQQPYIKQAHTNCTNPNNASSALGYFCNGAAAACPAFLTFRPAANQRLSAVAALLAIDPSFLAQANAITNLSATFPSETVIVVPVNCSCSGGYYQAEASYRVAGGDYYMSIAGNTFQGLTTCQALQNQNRSSANGYLLAGSDLPIPLRCACPTLSQTSSGVKYLLSYLVKQGDSVPVISATYDVAAEETLAANGLSFQDDVIYPSTTILLPMKNEPRIYLGVAPPPTALTPEPTATANFSRLYAAVGGSTGAALLLSLGFLCLVRRRKAKRSAGLPQAKPVQETLLKEVLSVVADTSPRVYKFQELQQATEDFSRERQIGSSSVYRAELGGNAVAVKRTSRDVSGELAVLTKMNHSSIIAPSGVCFHLGTWYLVHEFMGNGSLRDWIILRKGRSKVLPWICRVQIALDVANGLHYLHSFTDPPCVHRDVKSSNILMDSNFRAKMANLALSRSAAALVYGGELPLTGHIVGTFAYMAPEYAEHGLISPLADVYSFGIVMMELITGRDAAAAPPQGDGSFAAVLTTFLDGEGDIAEKMGAFIDPSLEGDYPPAQALTMGLLVNGCLEKKPEGRPDMGKVVHVLSAVLNDSSAYKVKADLLSAVENPYKS